MKMKKEEILLIKHIVSSKKVKKSFLLLENLKAPLSIVSYKLLDTYLSLIKSDDIETAQVAFTKKILRKT